MLAQVLWQMPGSPPQAYMKGRENTVNCLMGCSRCKGNFTDWSVQTIIHLRPQFHLSIFSLLKCFVMGRIFLKLKYFPVRELNPRPPACHASTPSTAPNCLVSSKGVKGCAQQFTSWQGAVNSIFFQSPHFKIEINVLFSN